MQMPYDMIREIFERCDKPTRLNMSMLNKRLHKEFKHIITEENKKDNLLNYIKHNGDADRIAAIYNDCDRNILETIKVFRPPDRDHTADPTHIITSDELYDGIKQALWYVDRHLLNEDAQQQQEVRSHWILKNYQKDRIGFVDIFPPCDSDLIQHSTNMILVVMKYNPRKIMAMKQTLRSFVGYQEYGNKENIYHYLHNKVPSYRSPPAHNYRKAAQYVRLMHHEFPGAFWLPIDDIHTLMFLILSQYEYLF